MTRLTNSDRGFTLVELLIVIAILAILVSIVALNVTDVTADTAQLAALQTETRLVQLAIDQYNTWDVAVNGAAAIPQQADPVQVSRATGSFGKYLATPTSYYYYWGAGGGALAASLSAGQ